jgi:hypothetical protein
MATHKAHRFRWTGLPGLVGVACVAAGLSCGPRHTETLIGPLPNGPRFAVLYPAGPSPQSSSQAGGEHRYVYTWACGPLEFEVIDNRLTVNGRDYGILQAGDAVVIDGRQGVRVTVNGVEIVPTEQPGSAPRPREKRD